MNNLTKKHYWTHKSTAKQRGIDFDLTYEEWLDIWMSSGFAHLRGVGKGKYCMSRHNDIGSYCIDNVSIIPHDKNAGDGQRGKVYSKETLKKFSDAAKAHGNRHRIGMKYNTTK